MATAGGWVAGHCPCSSSASGLVPRAWGGRPPKETGCRPSSAMTSNPTPRPVPTGAGKGPDKCLFQGSQLYRLRGRWRRQPTRPSAHG